jgi:hypothetical protein
VAADLADEALALAQDARKDVLAAKSGGRIVSDFSSLSLAHNVTTLLRLQFTNFRNKLECLSLASLSSLI